MTGQTEGWAPRPLAASGEFERTAPELCSPNPRCLHRKRRSAVRPDGALSGIVRDLTWPRGALTGPPFSRKSSRRSHSPETHPHIQAHTAPALVWVAIRCVAVGDRLGHARVSTADQDPPTADTVLNADPRMVPASTAASSNI